MPFIDPHSRFGVSLDRWLLIQSGPQPFGQPARCHAFEKEWIECADGIGQIRAKKECSLEYEDFFECMHRQKTFMRLAAIQKQRDKLIKEKSYTPPPHHIGNKEPQA
ncbi:NADH dehydrogenase [ubiquinone] iron-sulfur protein 5 [Salminus brasiliensis]|uniref:NADH dehydrogenase [ubiquinone] iron-sulfur protein 5 n=1 Tax=Salminus brasiliensis TaxID=930266 RepID=UPI003B82D426